MKKIVLMVAALGAVITTYAQERVVTPKSLAYSKAYGERDSIKGRELAVQFLKDYPVATTDPKADKAGYIEYHKIYNKVLPVPAKDMNKNVAQYINEMPFIALVDFYYHRITLYNMHKIEAPATILERSELLVKKMPSFKDQAPKEYSDLSADAWKQKYERAYYEMLLTHLHLLHSVGRDAAALPFATDANTYYKYKVSSLNDDHVQILLANGKKEKAQEVLETAVKNNQATPQMLVMLKENYIAAHKSDQGFDNYLAGLKDKTVQASMEEHIRKEFIKKEIPEFTVYDVNGKKVNSKDWIGKTVVLDFWASWCVPCKAAFPGMQLAKERLASQTDVVFYFVAVHEHKPGYKNEIQKFLTDKKYPFTVLFDGFDDDKSSEEATTKLGVGAIPHKMILDKNGLLRFSMMGYYGSPSQLADEIVMMVNMAKQ